MEKEERKKKRVALKGEKSIYETAEETPVYDTYQEIENIELEKKRNKSRLNKEHRNILFGQRPYEEAQEWYHNTIKYKKRLLGRYGMKAVEEPAGFVWPTPEEVNDMKEYERVAYPYSIQEEWARIEEKNRTNAEAIKAREAEVSQKMAKLDKWINDLNTRIAKKEADLLEAKKRKDRLIQEVRLELGSHVSIHDEKFKAVMAEKEKLEKKKLKEAKKKVKEEKKLARLAKLSQTDGDTTTASSSNEQIK
ncbi:PREDICTED: growth arrest and DNA damage-inducible proteins-interacting protein 1 isoform X2 [Polistes dominula]|uniref:Large ribosomal subunit protein mL64 n=1 Tax=Polistes dominula TaxID=743375 RepID=A0ABM1JCM1_POLDO|nr:PREDICTED: growth arrest and DNA damage-inducible proteins-interacting protein 1 isoform X2 [Polistes dominula]